MDFIFREMTTAILVDIYAARLTVVDLALYHCRIGSCLHFKSGDSVVMYVVALKVTLPKHKQQLPDRNVWQIEISIQERNEPSKKTV